MRISFIKNIIAEIQPLLRILLNEKLAASEKNN